MKKPLLRKERKQPLKSRGMRQGMMIAEHTGEGEGGRRVLSGQGRQPLKNRGMRQGMMTAVHTHRRGEGGGGGAFRVREWHPLKSRGMRLGRMTAVHTGRGEGGGGAVKGGLSGQEHRTHGSRIIRVRR